MSRNEHILYFGSKVVKFEWMVWPWRVLRAWPWMVPRLSKKKKKKVKFECIDVGICILLF